MDLCLAGYHAFRSKYFNKHNKHYEKLVRYGQNPKMLVISCSDSRVDPAIILNCEPGDLFVIRNVANLVPPYETDNGYHGTSAALEFGICNLNISRIVILGHTQCGGIATMMETSKIQNQGTFLNKWMEIAEPAYNKTLELHADKTKEEKHHECGKYALINSLNNLKTFSWISERIDNKSLTVYLWYFDLSTGLIESYNQEDKQFSTLR